MSKKITISLSHRSIEQAKKEILAYKRDLVKKCAAFVERLAELGIVVAKDNVSEGYSRYIVFGTEVEEENLGARAVMYATNTGLIRSEWRTNNNASGVATADVSPILMAEFGAGFPAEKNDKGPSFGMGIGTFPGQTHAEDPGGWWYMDMNYEWHHSEGVTPTMPMTRAMEAMIDSVVSVAREVFG